MGNPALDLLKSQIGKTFSNSPSPFAHWLKGTLVAAEEGTITCSFAVRKDMTNPAGTLHGGVTAGIIDDMIGATMFSMGSTHFHTSINLVVDYFATAREGDTITAKTHVVKQGKRLTNAGCEIHNKNGKLLAKGYSNLMKSELEVSVS